jgi:hypothetical protein
MEINNIINMIKVAINTIKRYYIKELYLASSRAQIYQLSLEELFVIALLSYPKFMLMLMITAIDLILFFAVFFAKKKTLSFEQRRALIVISLLLASSISLYLVGYVAIGGEFIQGGRALPIIQFLSIASLPLLANTSPRIMKTARQVKRAKVLMLVALIVAILFSVTANYGLQPYTKEIKVEGHVYTVRMGLVNGPVSDYVLSAIMFINTRADDVMFIGFEPYITFGYMDLAWNIKKMLIVGESFITSSDVINSLNKYLKLCGMRAHVVIPMTPCDNVIPGKLGYESFYSEPTLYLMNSCDLIYSDKFYMLFHR